MLIVAPNSAGEVETPSVAFGVEIQGVVGNCDLDAPAPRVDGGFGKPKCLPVAIERIALHQHIVPGASRIDLEGIPIPMIIEGIEPDHDAIVVPEQVVAQHQVCHDRLGVGVMATDAEVNEFSVGQDPNVRSLGRLGTGNRGDLKKGIDQRRLGPDRVVQLAVDLRGRLGPGNAHTGTNLFRLDNRGKGRGEDRRQQQPPGQAQVFTCILHSVSTRSLTCGRDSTVC